MALETPVALLLYNRPVQTVRLLAAIKPARPRKLLVVADGPRGNRPGDAQSVAAVRAAIERVDWPCEVQTNYSPINLGSKLRVSSGLNWVFEQEEEAIILEDDCIPGQSFFPFCENLLARYRYDPRILSIGGVNFHEDRSRTPASYYFSKYFLCWGWATWRRAWRQFDVTVREWPAWEARGGLRSIAESPQEEAYWRKNFGAVHACQIDAWDYAFSFASFRLGGLHAQPAVNLVSNVGFDAAATHTTQVGHRCANVPTKVLGELLHPPHVERDVATDRHTFANVYQGSRPTRWQRLLNSVTKRIAKLPAAWNRVQTWRKRRQLQRQLRTAPAPRIVMGAGGKSQVGWIAADLDELKLLHSTDWSAACAPESLDAILAEHVWEHLTVAEGLVAAQTCYHFLKPGGYVRIAVPDGWHPDPKYLEHVRPHGTGPGADSHQMLYHYPALQALFQHAGFEVQLLEYFDQDGRFHAHDWDPEAGLVHQSQRFDPRNSDGQLHYTSIILDAIKPLAKQRVESLPRHQAA